MTQRLTRQESQARTRAALLEAAARVFARKGLAGASIADVAAEAGFTKGAVYGHFASKDELVLAMLDERFAQRIAALDEQLAGEEEITDQARAGGDEFQTYVAGDRDWERLFFELAAHAARDEVLRREVVARYRLVIDRIAQTARRRGVAAGLEHTDEEIHRFAQMIFATSNGAALLALLDPDGVDDEFFADLFELLTVGAVVRAQAQS